MGGRNTRGGVSCRTARVELQDLLDRLAPASMGDTTRMSSFMSRRLNEHLEQCSSCREFFQTLVACAPLLRDQLDEAVADLPAPAFQAVLQARAAGRREGPVGAGRAAGRTAGLLRRIFGRLHAPQAGAVAVLRWAALPIVGVLLVSVISWRIRTDYRTRRVIQEQVDRTVELLYEEPLLSGVESALLRTRPTIDDYIDAYGDYMEDLGRAMGSDFIFD